MPLRIRIGEELETSNAAGSIIVTDAGKNAKYLAPGANNQILTFISGNPSWQTPATAVTTLTVNNANGLAGTSSGGATPALTLSTTITGVLQGNGTAISAAPTTGINTSNVMYSDQPVMSSTVASGSGLDIAANSLSSGSALRIISSSTAASSNTNTALLAVTSGTNANSNQTTFGANIQNTHSGIGATNVGLKVTASNGINNYAILATGKSGFNVSPTATVDIDVNASAAGGAQLKLDAGGILLTTPEPGAIENVGSHLFYTNDAGTRLQLDAQAGSGIAALTGDVTASGTGSVTATVVRTPALKSVTTDVNVSSATAPTTGQVLTATSSTAANWQTPSTGISGLTIGKIPVATSATTIGDSIIAAGANVGINTASPDSSSILDITSTTQGLLIPRMTNAQMNAIGAPSTGLQVFNTTHNALFVYNGTIWRMLAAGSSTPTIVVAAGTGTGGSVSISGTNEAGLITVTIGTLPSASSSICNITFANGLTYPTGGSMIITPASTTAVELSGTNQVYVTNSGFNNVVSIYCGSLPLSIGNYSWNYIIRGY